MPGSRERIPASPPDETATPWRRAPASGFGAAAVDEICPGGEQGQHARYLEAATQHHFHPEIGEVEVSRMPAKPVSWAVP